MKRKSMSFRHEIAVAQAKARNRFVPEFRGFVPALVRSVPVPLSLYFLGHDARCSKRKHKSAAGGGYTDQQKRAGRGGEVGTDEVLVINAFYSTFAKVR